MTLFEHQIKRRSDARIIRGALDEVKAIQTLLADVYKDVGDGRTLLRELVQNADDAEAERLVFVAIEVGWPDAHNSLLRGPALVVVNSGPFPAKDHEAMHQALGGAKAEDAGKVGRFGIGLKSVFHICEAIVYVGADKGVLRPGALNPWAGTGDQGVADPLHPDWDSVDDEDLDRLLGVANTLIGEFKNGLLQWIPLRQPRHLDRAQDRQYGIGQVCLEHGDVIECFSRPKSFAMLIAQCGHLKSIEAYQVPHPHSLNSRHKLTQVIRPNFIRCGWVGRYEDDIEISERTFQGRIEDGSLGWLAKGVEALGRDTLRQLRAMHDWPTDPHWRDGRCVWLPRKALAHAAITVLRPNDTISEHCGVRFRWAVFLPLDDDPSPNQSTTVSTLGNNADPNLWEIVLHGYFWPSHDRRSIPGVTNDDAGPGDIAVRVRWNRAVRDELLLPLLPRALENAVQGISDVAVESLLDAVSSYQTVQTHLHCVTRQHLLLPVVDENGIRWKVFPPDELNILAIPGWRKASIEFRRQFVTRLKEKNTVSTIFIDREAPKLGGDIGEWPSELVEILLDCISSEMFRTSKGLLWIQTLLLCLLGSPSDIADSRSAAAANWLVLRIGEGALKETTDGTATEAQEEIRAKWTAIFTTLPKTWLVGAPLATQQAVAELARDGVIGAGLLPVPLGRNDDINRFSRPDVQLLDSALLTLGKRLLENDDTSQRIRKSRLLLTEALLSVRGAEPLGEELSSVPLIRALKLPDDRDEAWSIANLQHQREQYRVFARHSDDGDDDGSALSAPSDPKKAVMELAEGIGESMWLVNSPIASGIRVPVPVINELALSVLSAQVIRSMTEKRLGLLQRIAQSPSIDNSTVKLAIITLLTGRKPVKENEHYHYYVRSQDSNKIANKKTLKILLRLLVRPWSEIEASLIEPLPYALVDSLQVKAVDSGILHELLQECLGGPVDWSMVEDNEAIHLLRCLHGGDDDNRTRWRRMPLHRWMGGSRGNINDKSMRAIGELELPYELKSEIRLIDPDPEVNGLYLDIPALDEHGILHAMLVSQLSHQFADRIVQTLHQGNDTQITLPHNPELRKLLKMMPWLPLRNGQSGVAPEKLILLPSDELWEAVVPLARAQVLSDGRLVDEVNPIVWSVAQDIVYEILNRPSPARQLQRLASAIDSSKIVEVDGGCYCLLPEAATIDASLIDDIIQCALSDAHRGWAIVRTAAKAVGIDGQNTLTGASAYVIDSVVKIARCLCGTVPAECQISVFNILASGRPARESSAGRVFQRFIGAFAKTNIFFSEVLSKIELPTQDGQWRKAYQIARSISGVARRHRLLSDLREPLRLNTEEPVRGEIAAEYHIESGSAEILSKYFASWDNRLPGGAVGAFLSLLGNGNHEAILDLSQQWLGEDISVDGMRRALDQNTDRDPCGSVRVFVSGRIASGKSVETINLLGELVEMEAGSEDDMIFAADPIRRQSSYGDFWEITLRDIEPHRRNANDLITLLGNTVVWWAVRVLRIEKQAVLSWWAKWGTGSQAQVGPVQASILAHLPLTLHQLDVSECTVLNDALRHTQRAQRRREQASAGQLNETIKSERQALDHLASLIRDEPQYQRFIWIRVQELIKRYGYREDSVLLELAQNADDALSQSAEITGRSLPREVRKLIVRVSQHCNAPTIDVIHYGRPINDTGGTAFPAGRDRQWDQDLYFMMLLNLSGKPGERPGQSSAASTTGRFGLGFKSVHLVSETPFIVSGFIAFSIAGGLLPFEQTVPNDPEIEPVQDHQVTRIRLPLCGGNDASSLIVKMFQRFSHTRAILPAFARGICEVVVEGGPQPGLSAFDPEQIGGAPGWSVAKGDVGLPGHGQWRLLRFRPADAEIGQGTEALVIGLREWVPEMLPSEVPFLWNVTPTSEDWGCGYAINGPFKLDPGRTHVSIDDPETMRVVNLLGEAFGRGLLELHDALVNGTSEFAHGLPTGENAREFLASLWRVLIVGIANRDDLRKGLLLRLHGPQRGVSLWMTSRSVVPSGLPSPFLHRLPKLEDGTIIKIAAGGLDDPKLCHAISQVDDLASIIRGHYVISNEIAQFLRPLMIIDRQLSPWDIFRELTERWDNILTPERLHALRPLAEDSVWKAILNEQLSTFWHAKLLARSVAGNSSSLRDLLLPHMPTISEFDETAEDELRRASFAPDESVIDPTYIECADDLKIFLRLRVRHEIDAELMASWYQDLPANRRAAALRYLLDGRLQNEVLKRLVNTDTRPFWLREYDDVCRLLDSLDNIEKLRVRVLLATLFPDHFQPTLEPTKPETTIPEPARRTFFERFDEWWNEDDERKRVIESYESKAWPDWLRKGGIAEGLKSDSPNHWLGLLVLGACRSLGFTTAAHHRNFLEDAHREGWWDVFRKPIDTVAWMEMLRAWQDSGVDRLKHLRWMSLFPVIYQLSRYLDKYRRLLRSAGRRPEELYRVTCLLAPRVDEALTGAGQHFDAPPAPLNMGLHWVLRELVRLHIIDGNHIFPDCWVPSEQVLRFLRPLGLNTPDNNTSNPEKAMAVFKFLATEMRTDTPHLHRAFDIPLRHVDGEPELRRQLGLED